MPYPHLPESPTPQALAEHFTLDAEDRVFLDTLKKQSYRLGLAVLLKVYIFLGRPPRSKSEIPSEVVQWLAGQMEHPVEAFRRYRWDGPVWKHHLSLVRKRCGMRPHRERDRVRLLDTLSGRGNDLVTREKMVHGKDSCKKSNRLGPSIRDRWQLHPKEMLQ